MERTVEKVQQSFAECSGYKTNTYWDKYANDDGDFLKLKLKHLIPDVKVNEEALVKALKAKDDREKTRKEIESTNKKLEKTRQDIFDSVWAQRKYTNKNLLASIIYVLVTEETEEKAALKATKFSSHPVFRTRKCTLPNDTESSKNCCMAFVDENGRVYQNWQSYVEDNMLPVGMMIAPCNGIYTMVGDNEKVELQVCQTPACSWSSWLARKADTTSMVGGFGAAAVPLAALAMPVAAPIMLGATAVGLASAGYSALRSGYSLYDRKTHERPIGLDDSQARGSWLGVLGGTIGLGAMGATQFVTKAASSGQTISTGAKVLVNGMNISTILISGGGVANGVLDLVVKYRDDEDVNIIDVMQLAASLALFTHSVYNFRMASTIISETQDSTIQSMRQNYSRNQRKMFEKLSKETVRINGVERGKSDIIRNANKLDKQAFNDLFKINKQLNQQKVRPSFSSNGEGVVLNNDLHVDAAALRQNPNIAEQVRQPIPETHGEATGTRQTSTTRQMFATGANNNNNNNNILNETDVFQIVDGIKNLTVMGLNGKTIVVKLKNYSDDLRKHIQNGETFLDILIELAKKCCEDVVNYLLRLTSDFIVGCAADIEMKLNSSVASETVLFRIVKLILQEYCVDQLTIKCINDFKPKIIAGLRMYFDSLKTNAPKEVKRVKCDECEGFYTIVDL